MISCFDRSESKRPGISRRTREEKKARARDYRSHVRLERRRAAVLRVENHLVLQVAGSNLGRHLDVHIVLVSTTRVVLCFDASRTQGFLHQRKHSPPSATAAIRNLNLSVVINCFVAFCGSMMT